MSRPELPALALATIRSPATAARDLMALNLPSQALWAGLGLVAVAHALFYLFSETVSPSPVTQIIGSPLRYFLLVAVNMALTAFALHRVGRMMGGEAALDDVLVLIVWLNGLYLVSLLAVLLIGLAVPLLGMVLVFATVILGFWITLHFVNEAHRLGSLFRAFGVIVAAIIVVFICLSLVQVILGLPTGGTLPDV